jgi:hypothetical protein
MQPSENLNRLTIGAVMRLLIPVVVAALLYTSDVQGADPLALMKSMDGFRKEVPAAETLSEQNGATIKDPDGNSFTLTRLAKAATLLGAKDNADCIVLLTYLNHADPKIRFIAATAIENVVHAFPEGLTANTKLESKDHHEMIRRFAEKLSDGANTRLLLARSAAKAFCTTFDFPAEKIAKLSNPPLLGPSAFQREGMDVVAYRWLGAGRGADIVQVELQGNGKIIVRGGSGHKELGPWEYVP